MAGEVTVTVTPGTDLFCWSVTAPRIVPVCSPWANAALVTSSAIAGTRINPLIDATPQLWRGRRRNSAAGPISGLCFKAPALGGFGIYRLNRRRAGASIGGKWQENRLLASLDPPDRPPLLRSTVALRRAAVCSCRSVSLGFTSRGTVDARSWRAES